MSLRQLSFPPIIDTSSGDPIADFFQPVLTRAARYDRGVGFFSSGWLRLNAAGLVSFAANGGRARWVTSPILDAADWEALQLGEAARVDNVLQTALRRNIRDLQQALERETLSALAWMIADGVMTFKFALPHNKLSGDFHDKFGVFADEEGNRVAFMGSPNESIQGTVNSESFSVYASWQEPALLPYLDHIEQRFMRLWDGKDPNVRVYDLPEAIRDEILRLRDGERPYPVPAWVWELHEQRKRYSALRPYLPADLTLRDYQEEAIAAWFANDCRGLLEMATGTGKTITALAAAVRLFERERRLALIIAVPYQHLVDQWQAEAETFGLRPLLAYQSRQRWLDTLNQEIVAYNGGYRDIVCVITTHSTFSGDDFQATLGRLTGPALLIADEAHHLGAEQRRRRYPQHVDYRLALSATPDRWFDDAGTAALRTYFGPTVFEFPLARAIGVSLTPYYYYPQLVELTDDEMAEYQELSHRIARLYGSDDPEKQEAYEMLLIKRARLLNEAENKLAVLSELLDSQRNLRHALFYCAPGQIDAAQRLIGWEKGLLVNRFTAQESNAERQELLQRFAGGELQGLVAMKCLDEGVDVPNTRIAYFLASSGNPREFVQRRGRILRRAEGKSHAVIYDLITVPPTAGLSSTTYQVERSILRRELARFHEFAGVALNKHEALDVIWEIASYYQLRDLAS